MRWYVSVRARNNYTNLKCKSGRTDSRTTRRWREVRNIFGYWRSFWSAPVFSGAFYGVVCFCARGQSLHAPAKAAEETAALQDAGARFAISLDTGEAFGVRLSFLALFLRPHKI